jgi:hypothetical protein
MNRDTPERYISGLAAVNTNHAVLALKRNKMYDVEQIGELTSVEPIGGLTKRKDKDRKEEVVDCWVVSNVPIQVDSPKFPVKFNSSHGTQELLDVMKRDVVRGGYFGFVTTNKLFKLYALTSVYTSNEAAFEELYKLDQQGQQEFEMICQDMVGNLYHLQESSILCGSGVSKSFASFPNFYIFTDKTRTYLPRTYLQAKSTMRHHTIPCPFDCIQGMDQGCTYQTLLSETRNDSFFVQFSFYCSWFVTRQVGC